MNMFKKLEREIAFGKVRRDFDREFNASYRAAGTKRNSDANKASSNSTAINHDSDAKSIAEQAVMIAHEANMAAHQSIVQSGEAQMVAERAVEVASGIANTLAEQQAPVEEPGAEKLDDNAVAMSSVVHPVDPDSKINMDIFGVSFDKDLLVGASDYPQQLVEEQQMQQLAMQQQMNPNMYYSQQPIPMGQPMMGYPQMVQQPMIGYNPQMMMPMVQQPVQQPQPMTRRDKFFAEQKQSNFIQQPHMPGEGRHRIDNPVPPKPKQVMNPVDNVDTTGMPEQLIPDDMINPIEAKIKIDEVRLVEPDPNSDVKPPEPVSAFADSNKEYIKRYPYLKDIESIAIENGYQIFFQTKAGTDMIECYICNQNQVPIAGKGFAIDNGNIIDGRKKVFAYISAAYEAVPCYPLVDTTNGNKSIDKDLIKALIIGGAQAVTTKPLFNPNYMELNKVVALITIPTNKIRKDDRKYIQSRLMDVFVKTDILKKYLGRSRFKVNAFNNGTITLTSAGIPLNYGNPVVSADNVEITITNDNVAEKVLA